MLFLGVVRLAPKFRLFGGVGYGISGWGWRGFVGGFDLVGIVHLTGGLLRGHTILFVWFWLDSSGALRSRAWVGLTLGLLVPV